MANEKTILITGATGKQGGAVARELSGKGFRLRAMTRRPQGDAARALAQLGAEVVEGNLDQEDSLRRALAGAWGVFAVQTPYEAGVDVEEAQGLRLARLARESGVQHYVYTSVGSAHRQTGIPHFENKFRVEQEVRRLGFPSHVVLRPVFFMENLTSPWFFQGDKLTAAMAPSTSLQMIAVEDIGKYGARAFTHASEMNGRAVDIAGDAKTMPQAAAVLGKTLGREIPFVQIPIDVVRQNSEDFALMLEWFDRVGYNVDVPGLAREYGIQPTTLEAWARTHAKG